MTTLQESRKLVPQIASCDASLDYGSPVVDGLVAISTPTRLVRSESDASCDYGDWGLESSSAREMTEHDVVISRNSSRGLASDGQQTADDASWDYAPAHRTLAS
jgi:hypothetical protein